MYSKYPVYSKYPAYSAFFARPTVSASVVMCVMFCIVAVSDRKEQAYSMLCG